MVIINTNLLANNIEKSYINIIIIIDANIKTVIKILIIIYTNIIVNNI